MSSKRNLAIVHALFLGMALASTHFFKQSVATMMYLSPEPFARGLMGPTKSIPHFTNALANMIGLKGIDS